MIERQTGDALDWSDAPSQNSSVHIKIASKQVGFLSSYQSIPTLDGSLLHGNLARGNRRGGGARRSSAVAGEIRWEKVGGAFGGAGAAAGEEHDDGAGELAKRPPSYPDIVPRACSPFQIRPINAHANLPMSDRSCRMAQSPRSCLSKKKPGPWQRLFSCCLKKRKLIFFSLN
jgi:hypothetical protein